MLKKPAIVLAFSILTQVTATFAQQHTHTLNITVDGETIETTDGALRHCTSHPLLNADGVWVNTQDLQVGDEIVSANGDVGVVEAIERINEPRMMYNLSVAVVATYLVGDGGWVVHNVDELIRIQRQIGNEIFRDVLGGRNILFGQKRVSRTFSRGGLVPDQLQGQDIFDIAEQLRLVSIREIS